MNVIVPAGCVYWISVASTVQTQSQSEDVNVEDRRRNVSQMSTQICCN